MEEKNTGLQQHNDFQDKEADQELTLPEMILGKDYAETLKELVKGVNEYVIAQAQRQKDKTQIEKQQLDNQLKLSENQLKVYENQKEIIENEQRFVAGFDIRNKVYSGLTLLALAVFVYILLDKKYIGGDVLNLILGIMITVVSIANVDILGKILNRNQQNTIPKK